ncbi:GNAT family N-acetyltransferase [Altererythrobacter sp. H2]|uniref:GNAT family N-acetyltransferase n=1 Tax=Altererythrobacter sp. H2 TaxID=3108391 RepID=UPI000BC5F05A|nr:GNAT family N-acetyltransferase [Altererythrobacter sp. H2]OZA92079.1 MAG: ribosomal-protein-alanine acetyltransferase [Erythrobacter sp. 34-65-8]WRK96853.1 GNAT family N-acetyltransferase [Altererythrobacter sp. H2]
MMDDVDRIMAVMQAAFDPRWGEAWSRRQVEDSLALPSTHYVVLSADGTPLAEGEPAAGFALSRHLAGEAELLLLGVDPAWRGRGIARALLSIVFAEARNRGAEQLFLEMRHNNPAERLYRAIGFEPVGRRPAYYKLADGTRLDAVTFALRLT